MLPAVQQQVWGGKAVVNFACGGAGAGLVVAAFAVGLASPAAAPALRGLEALGLLLVGIGFASVAAEAGRPLRALYVFRHLRRSWMSREAAAALLFGILVAAGLWTPHPLPRALAAAAGLAFMATQGFILFAARAVPAWRMWQVPVLFVTSGIAKGLGLLLVGAALAGVAPTLLPAAWLAGSVLLLDLGAWAGYVAAKGGPPARREALALLKWGRVAAGVVGLGHAVPLALLAAGLGWDLPAPGLLALAGGCMVAGGAFLKWAVVRRAGRLHPLGLGADFSGVGRGG
jgi:phenylacetyl-CoA:acceptor oxidoreductase subunit 2